MVNPQFQSLVFKKNLESKYFKGLFRKNEGWISEQPYQRCLLSVCSFLGLTSCLIIGRLQGCMETSCYLKKKNITTAHHLGDFSAFQKLTQLLQAAGIALPWSEYAEMQWGWPAEHFPGLGHFIRSSSGVDYELSLCIEAPRCPQSLFVQMLKDHGAELKPRLH